MEKPRPPTLRMGSRGPRSPKAGTAAWCGLAEDPYSVRACRTEEEHEQDHHEQGHDQHPRDVAVSVHGRRPPLPSVAYLQARLWFTRSNGRKVGGQRRFERMLDCGIAQY